MTAVTFDSSGAALARAVFNALLDHATLTRAAIAELTGLSRVTASGIVDQLIHRGFVTHVGALASNTGGPSARAYALSDDSAYVLGIAVDGYRIAIMTASVTGHIVSRHEEPIDDDEAVSPAVERAVTNEFSKLNAPLDKLKYIVIGASGVIDPTAHELAFAVNSPSWKSNLAAQLRRSLRCPVAFENDVNLAALAESRFGAGANVPNADGSRADDMVLVWLDEGIACGVILGGRLYRGAAGWAGEIAFLPAHVDGWADFERGTQSSRTTTLQRAIGSRGVVALAQGHELDPDVLIRHAAATSSGETHDALEAGFTELARRIALAVAGPAFVFDPDLVVLAGRTVRLGGERLLERVRQELAAIGPAPARIALSETGPDAILTGSMLLALVRARDELFEEQAE